MASFALTGLTGMLILTAFYIYKRYFTFRNTSGLPLPPGPPPEPFFGHFRTVPLENPEFSYVKWGKEYGMLQRTSYSPCARPASQC
jgi:hypothetical protein